MARGPDERELFDQSLFLLVIGKYEMFLIYGTKSMNERDL